MNGCTNSSISGNAGYENVNVVIASNQSDFSEIVGVEVTLTIIQDNSVIKEIWQGDDLFFRVPRGANYVVSFSEALNYRKPENYSSTAEAGRSITINATYETEVVTVSVTAEEGVSVAGQVITINGTTHTLDASGKAIQKVAYGTQYTITASGKTNYFTPDPITRTAQNASYSASMYYALANETLTVNVSGMSSGFTITVKDNAGNTLGTSTSANSTFAIPNGTKYTVSASSVTGYNISGTGTTYTAVGGSSRTVGVTYTLKTYTLTVNVSGISSGFNVSVVNGGTTTSQTATSKTYTVTHGASYSVTGGAVTGYNVSGNASGTMTGDKTVTISYTLKTYTLTVNVIGLSSEFSLTVKYGSTTKTQTATSATYTVSHGQSWSVSGENVFNGNGTYITPGAFGTITGDKTVTITYTYHAGTLNPGNGIYIKDVDNYYHNESDWDNSYTANCIAVITDKCRFGIALADISGRPLWSVSKFVVENITTTMSSTEAKKDYGGYSNTNIVISQHSSDEVPAFYKCQSYIFPNKQRGYMGAAGEWWTVLQNIDAIETALVKCSGGTLENKQYFTSTQYNIAYMWSINFVQSSLDSGKAKYHTQIYTRAFCII